jgi:peptidoglycan/LPS O-acetylase OafA/YrhL
MKSPNAPYLERLDHLRFLAAALVLLFHFFHTHVGDSRPDNPLLSLIDEGHTGIGLFMVISGFILTVVANGQPVRWAGFMRNRVLRIYPLFVFAVFLQLMISTYNDHRNYGFLQLLGWLMPFRSETVPLSPHFVQLWSIWVEFQFYLIFPFLHAFALRLGSRYLWALLGLMILVKALVFAATGSVRYLAYETIFGRLDQFLLGMVIGRAYLAYQLSSPVKPDGATVALATGNPGWLVVALSLAVAGVHTFSRQVGYTNISSPWWILWPTVEGLLWGAVLWSYLTARFTGPSWLIRPLSKALARLGALSFSIYVMHNLVITAYNKQAALLPVGDSLMLQSLATGILVVLPLVTLLSAVTYALIERPFLSFRGGYINAGPAQIKGERTE